MPRVDVSIDEDHVRDVGKPAAVVDVRSTNAAV